jgi:2'-5' RNA ligase
MRNSKNRTVMAFWLMPAKAERELFSELIGILAKQLKAPAFQPHLTLFWVRGTAYSAGRILKEIRTAPLRLSVRDVRSSPKFTKTLFVRFRPNAALNELAATMQRASGARRAGIAEPHLSLCYKKLPAPTREQLAAMLRLPLKRVRFDSVKAVRCALPTRTAKEVKAWRTVARKKLSG